jgi:hypothetical protein
LDSKREIAERFDLIAPFLDERMRRLWAAAESQAMGRGGIALVARASGVSRRAIRVGISELRVTLIGADPNGLTLTYRVVSQPVNGTVAINGNVATYLPAAGFKGADTFTFAAFDGKVDSNLGTITVTVN